jgi:hypothetical protein
VVAIVFVRLLHSLLSGNIFRKAAWSPIMRNTSKAAVTVHRERRKRQGFVRLEVQVRREDAPLLRGIAGALADPAQAAEARAVLREHFASRKAKSLKALLADAPLDGIDLDRSDDPGREVEL